MIKYAACIAPLILLFNISIICAQEFIGLRTGIYAGSNGMLFNPATPLSGKLPWDFNAIAAGVFEDNNYISIPDPLLKYMRTADTFLHVGYFQPEKVYAHANTVLQFPSGFMKFDNYAAGFFFTMRNAGYLSSGKDSSGVTGLLDLPLNEPLYMPEFEGGTLCWVEMGINGEITISRSSVFNVYAGMNLKYLAGFEAMSISNNSAFTFTKDSTSMSISSFNTEFDYTDNLGSNKLYDPSNYNINGNGLGVDLGMYVVINGRSKFKSSKSQDYLWKFGASLLDFGFIKFNKNSGCYHLEQDEEFSILNSTLDSLDDIDEFNHTGSRIIYDYEGASKYAGSFTMFLPSAITVSADHAFAHHFYAEAIIVRRIPRLNKNLIARANTIAITPRYERSAIGIAMPVELYEDNELHVGLSVRVWYVTIGTDNLGTYFHQPDYSSINLYAGVRLAPYQLVSDKRKKILECLKSDSF